MAKYRIPKLFSLKELPAYKKFQADNPKSMITGLNSAIMFGQAIQWLSILEVLWPDFETLNYYSVEVKYIVINDPDNESLPEEFYTQIAKVLEMFWKMQLSDLYPNGIWTVEVADDPEMTVEAIIVQRNQG